MTFRENLGSLVIEITNRCNLKCRMCVSHGAGLYKGQADKHPTFIDIDFFKSIVKQYQALRIQGNKVVTPQFQGEPLLHPRFLEICEFLEELQMRFNFTTNASLLTPEISRQILNMKMFSGINFSIDGYTKQTYENIRLGANYEKIKSNIMKFLDLAKVRIKKGLSVGVIYTEQPLNKHETAPFIRKWIRRVPAVAINNVAVGGRPQKVFYRPKRFPCRDIWSFMIILTNGQVVPCCRDYLYQFNLGDLHVDGLQDIWFGKEYRRMRQLHTAGFWDDISLCSDCDTWMVHYKPWLKHKWIVFPDIIFERGPFFITVTKIRASNFLYGLKERLLKMLRERILGPINL